METEVPAGWHDVDELREENGERRAFDLISGSQHEQLQAMCVQQLSMAGLSHRWADTVLALTRQAVQLVRPAVRQDGDDMDIRQYVQLKKIPGGNRGDSSIALGVVCSKNIPHRKMRSHISSPKILLLRAPIEYQRVENKFSSLEPQILQEHEFLRHCVGRIAALQPDVLVVEKTVSRVAQDFLLDAGITVVFNVKPAVMERIARFTQADMVTSIDGLVSRTSLGRCDVFKTQTFLLPDGGYKTLMYFDGCPPHLGCTVTLRGGPLAELRRVKKIVLFMLYATYHLKLELSFLMDEFAMPPAGPDNNPILIGETDSQSQPPLPANQLDASLQISANQSEPRLEKPSSADQSNDLKAKEQTTKQKEAKTDNNEQKTSEAPSKDTKIDHEATKDPHNEPARADKSDKMTPENRVKKMNASKHGSRTSEILDFTDPLQNYQISKDETIFHSQGTLQEDKAHKLRFKKALKEVQLSISPLMRYSIPYLETEKGQQSKTKKFFQGQLYWSEHFSDSVGNRKNRWMSEEQAVKKETKVELAEPHPFLQNRLTAPLTNPNIQAMLAEYRARGGRIMLTEKSSNNKGVEMRNHSDRDNGRHEGKVDCLDPAYHQRIHVLFGSHSNEAIPSPCVSPWVVSMDYYGRNDITLGQFLERYCFRSAYRCPSESCGGGTMLEHTRRFVHHAGCISVTLERQQRPLPNSVVAGAGVGGSAAAALLMWSWCTKCKQVTPVVPMSLDTWSMSFAKYLELRFHANMYSRRGSAEVCSHSLHHDHHQYFGYQSIVAKFKYYSVDLKEIALPPIIVAIQHPKVDDQALMEEVKGLQFKGTGVYNAVWQHLHDESQAELITGLADLKMQLQREKEMFAQQMDGLQSLLSSLNLDLDQRTQRNLAFEIQDQITESKIHVSGAVIGWNNRLSELEQPQKRQERNKLKVPGEKNREPSPDPSVTSSDTSRRSTVKEEEHEPTFFLATSSESTITTVPEDFVSSSSAAVPPSQNAPVTWTDTESLDTRMVGESVSSTTSKGSTLSELSQGKSSSETVDGEGKSHQRSKSIGEKKPSSGNVKHHGEEGVSEKKNRKNIFSSFLTSSGQALIPMPFPPNEHYLLRPPYEKVPIVVYDQEPSSIIAYTLSTQEYERQLEELKLEKLIHQPSPAISKKQVKPSDPSNLPAQDPSTTEPAETASNRGSKVLSFFRGADAIPREKSPSRSKFDDSAVKYTPKLDRDSVEETDDDISTLFSGTAEGDKSNSNNSQQPKQPGTAKSKEAEVNHHIEMQFSDTTARFYCRVYYAEQFKNIRKLIFPEGEERYIRSLSRCFTWLARGGKSGSNFCKTQDDRFILKQMSRYEVQSFVEFAPHYFSYITQAYKEQRPTALAKILGVYRIGYKNSQTNSDLKQDLLVMENLFYDRKITQIYDLKGSVRNRLVSTSGKRVEELVLLDENLLKTNVDSPLYIRPHSKTVLTLGITQDTEFLSSHLVMDYSLLVGVDDNSKELVIGIIDYIRTFTWDKKLEMVVKSTLAGQGKMPTVVSPELYRNRFLDAMERYFLLVPDRWTGLGRNVDC